MDTCTIGVRFWRLTGKQACAMPYSGGPVLSGAAGCSMLLRAATRIHHPFLWPRAVAPCIPAPQHYEGHTLFAAASRRRTTVMLGTFLFWRRLMGWWIRYHAQCGPWRSTSVLTVGVVGPPSSRSEPSHNQITSLDRIPIEIQPRFACKLPTSRGHGDMRLGTAGTKQVQTRRKRVHKSLPSWQIHCILDTRSAKPNGLPC